MEFSRLYRVVWILRLLLIIVMGWCDGGVVFFVFIIVCLVVYLVFGGGVLVILGMYLWWNYVVFSGLLVSLWCMMGISCLLMSMFSKLSRVMMGGVGDCMCRVV